MLERAGSAASITSGTSSSAGGTDSADFDYQATNQKSIQRVERLSRKHNRALTPTEIVRVELEFNSLNYTLMPMSKGLFVQIVCLCPAKTAEMLLSRLVTLGIGRRHNTSVNLFNPTVSRTGRDKAGLGAGKPGGGSGDDDDDEADGDEGRMQAFMDSMRARLMVSQVYRSVMDKGRWTFDFVCFLVCATIIAAVGLATNSSVMTVASMLLSPYMGPILALTFSWRLGRVKAVLRCAYNTLLATGIIFLTGFVMLFVLIGPLLLLGVKAFPTQEMTDRGQHASLLFGIIVASASAYGVSVSVLQGDHSANVGVAISASLLPPVVNSGMLLAYCLMAAFRPPTLVSPAAAAAANATSAGSLNPPDCVYRHFDQFEFAPVYVCSVTSELLIMSAQSMVLCLLNIILIVLCSYFWLALKEVAPDRTERSDANREFFSHDIRFARENDDCLHGDSRTQLQSEYAAFRKVISGENIVEKFTETLGGVMSDTNYRTICANSNADPLAVDPSSAKRFARTLSVRQRRNLASVEARGAAANSAPSAKLRPFQLQQEPSGASSSGASISLDLVDPASPTGKKHGRFSVKPTTSAV
ncbi:hypothetical protein BOX15_Mlig002025g8 [Macrostomum lignano]|uniref:DUF389 domain-containing protein n=1 Tax=Macrostomum lignano TaxID=282301 RepID=A0A267DDG5_9PLAT|nr:hypothetical protein BOX15_Mlig002025g8 [Macrostomum lignano]